MRSAFEQAIGGNVSSGPHGCRGAGGFWGRGRSCAGQRHRRGGRPAARSQPRPAAVVGTNSSHCHGFIAVSKPSMGFVIANATARPLMASTAAGSWTSGSRRVQHLAAVERHHRHAEEEQRGTRMTHRFHFAGQRHRQHVKGVFDLPAVVVERASSTARLCLAARWTAHESPCPRRALARRAPR